MSKSSEPKVREVVRKHRYVDIWMDVLDEDVTDIGRLARGRMYYALDHVQSMQVEPGEIRGHVRGSGYMMYRTSIRVNPYLDSEWELIENESLSGLEPIEDLPPERVLIQLDRRWRALGLPTFAEQIECGIDARCSCWDGANFCKHVVALWHAFGERLSDDPAALIRLFGGPDSLLRRMRPRERSVRKVDDMLPLVFLPADAERNLQDRSIKELVSRFWRPVREIRQSEDLGRMASSLSDCDLPVDDFSGLPCEDPQVVRQALEQMYAEVRRRAMGVCIDIESSRSK